MAKTTQKTVTVEAAIAAFDGLLDPCYTPVAGHFAADGWDEEALECFLDLVPADEAGWWGAPIPGTRAALRWDRTSATHGVLSVIPKFQGYVCDVALRVLTDVDAG